MLKSHSPELSEAVASRPLSDQRAPEGQTVLLPHQCEIPFWTQISTDDSMTLERWPSITAFSITCQLLCAN